MLDPRLPELPEPDLYGMAGPYFADAKLHAYGLAVWKAAIEAAALTCEQERPHAPGEYCPWSDESEARYQAFTDAASAIRSLPDPSATPQDQGGER